MSRVCVDAVGAGEAVAVVVGAMGAMGVMATMLEAVEAMEVLRLLETKVAGSPRVGEASATEAVVGAVVRVAADEAAGADVEVQGIRWVPQCWQPAPPQLVVPVLSRRIETIEMHSCPIYVRE